MLYSYIYYLFTGGNCEPQDIDVHLKPGGFPVVSPQNISFPEDFMDNNLRNEITSMKMESDESNNTLTIHNPVPGDWFALAFVSWTDPKSDKIEQQGILSIFSINMYPVILKIIKTCGYM